MLVKSRKPERKEIDVVRPQICLRLSDRFSSSFWDDESGPKELFHASTHFQFPPPQQVSAILSLVYLATRLT